MTWRRRSLGVVAAVPLIAWLGHDLRAQDRARQIWDSYFGPSRPKPSTNVPANPPKYRPVQPTTPAATTPPASSGTALGITLWKVEPSREADQARLLVQEGEANRPFTPHRVEAGELLQEGDRVRISIESARSGQLFIVDQELHHDGTLGSPHLVFPTRRIRNGDNRVTGGKLVELPAQSDATNTFTLRGRDTGYAGEQLSVILSRQPLPGFVLPDDAQALTDTVWQSWQQQFNGAPAPEHYELQGGKGRAWTAAEQQAGGLNGRLLTLADPAPQTLFFFSGTASDVLAAVIRLQIQSAATRR